MELVLKFGYLRVGKRQKKKRYKRRKAFTVWKSRKTPGLPEIETKQKTDIGQNQSRANCFVNLLCNGKAKLFCLSSIASCYAN